MPHVPNLPGLRRRRPIVAVDIDGILCEDQGPYRRRTPRPGAQKWLEALMEHWTVVLYTSRPASSARDTHWWLRKHEFVYDRVKFGQMRATVYLNDRAIRWTGESSFPTDLTPESLPEWLAETASPDAGAEPE